MADFRAFGIEEDVGGDAGDAVALGEGVIAGEGGFGKAGFVLREVNEDEDEGVGGVVVPFRL